MEDEFIYWPHPTPVGIRVEEVSGMESKSGRLWEVMARQIYCENGRDGFREIGHFPDGAPFIFGVPSRISITHTDHLYAVATLPKTPEADLARFSQRTALGIDAEPLEREQVKRVRERFLSEEEFHLAPPDDLESLIIAWTAKEALYKAALTPGLDLRHDIRLISLPQIDRKMNIPGAPAPVIGNAIISIPDPDFTDDPDSPSSSKKPRKEYEMELYSYESEGKSLRYCITLAYSPKCAKFSKKN